MRKTNDQVFIDLARRLEAANQIVQAAWNEQHLSPAAARQLNIHLQEAAREAEELERRATAGLKLTEVA